MGYQTLIPCVEYVHGPDHEWPRVNSAKQAQAMRRVAERGLVWDFRKPDDQIAALVEVGAIPYRERYERRHIA